MKTKLSLAVFALMFSSTILAQTKEDVAKIVSEYDLDKIKSKEIEFKKKQQERKRIAEEAARKNGWEISRVKKTEVMKS